MSQTAERDALPTLTRMRVDLAVMPSLRVAVTQSDGTTAEAELGIVPILIGTSSACDIVLTDPSVSRRHCALAITERGVMLRDLQSKNGTRYAGARVVELMLPARAQVQIGDATLTLWQAGEDKELPLAQNARFGEAVGGSIAMRALFSVLEKASASDATILLLGESGTGKELLARGIHERSPRREGPFVVCDAGAIAPNLIESALFGHTRGAFTGATQDHVGVFEAAAGGTVLLDEVGELPVELQPKLLRAIDQRAVKPVGSNDYRPFDARIIAATHRDLLGRVAEGQFRQDLYYRLAVVRADVPPLREREGDVELLASRFLAELEPPRTIDDLAPATVQMLKAHGWPGNVRELRNAVARLSLFPDLGEGVLDTVGAPASSTGLDARVAAMPLRPARDLVVERFEQQYIRRRLREHQGNVTQCAKTIGVSRQLLHRMMERHGIKRDE